MQDGPSLLGRRDVLSCTFGLFGTVPDGQYTVTYTGRSADGETSGSYSFYVDRTPPSAPTGLAISPDPYVSAGTLLTVSGTVLDATAVEVTLSSSGGGTPLVESAAPSGSTFQVGFNGLQLAGLANGTLTASVRATDRAGYGSAATTTSTKNVSTSTPPANPDLAASSTSINPVSPIIAVNDSVILSGRVSRGDESVARGQVRVDVTDDRRKVSVAGTAAVGADGSWSLTLKPTSNGVYTARYLGDSRNAASSSPSQTTKVRVLIRATATRGPAAKRATVRGSVKPAKKGAKIFLYRVDKRRPVKVAQALVGADGRFVFSLVLPRGRTALEVRIKSTTGNLGNELRLDAVRTG